MTLSNARKALSAVGVVLRKEDGEYIVKAKGCTDEALWYYTDDLDDALNTGMLYFASSN